MSLSLKQQLNNANTELSAIEGEVKYTFINESVYPT